MCIVAANGQGMKILDFRRKAAELIYHHPWWTQGAILVFSFVWWYIGSDTKLEGKLNLILSVGFLVLLEFLSLVLEDSARKEEYLNIASQTGEIVKSLSLVASFKGTELLSEHRRKYLASKDLPTESIRKVITNWCNRCYGKNVSSDLWYLLSLYYMEEEHKDIGQGKIATNIEIYTELLMTYYRYFFDSSPGNSKVFILTTLLPSMWYKRHEGCDQNDFNHIESYRDSLKAYIKPFRAAKTRWLPDALERYIAVVEHEKNAVDYQVRSLTTLKEDIEQRPKDFERYLSELHFKPGQAKYVCVEGAAGNFTAKIKDLVVFGRDGNWEWGIKSDLIITHPTMFVTFYDESSLGVHDQQGGPSIAGIIKAIKAHDKCRNLEELRAK